MISPGVLDRILTKGAFALSGRRVSAVLDALLGGASLVEAFRAGGIYTAATRTLKQAADQTLAAFGSAYQIDAALTGSLSRRAVLVGQSFAQQSLAHLAGLAEPNLRTGLRLYQTGQISKRALTALLPVPQINTLVNTGLAGIQRQVSKQAAQLVTESGAILYLYAGPDDAAARPYCAALAGLVVEESALANTPNAQGLNPTVYCGGYNCRHSLIPVNESIVREQGLTLATASDYSAAATGAASGRR